MENDQLPKTVVHLVGLRQSIHFWVQSAPFGIAQTT